MTKFLQHIKSQWPLWLSCLILVVSAIVLYYAYNQQRSSERQIEEIEYIDDMNNYNKVYYENQFKTLKSENKQLYDSLKIYKEKIEYLVQFTYTKSSKTDKVKVENRDETIHDTVKQYTYTSEPNDTFTYKLDVGAYTEPVWYSMSVTMKEKFTIINRNLQGSDVNHITVGSQGSGTFSDETVFKRQEKKKLKDRIKMGPSVTFGYDPINDRFALVGGVSVTFDIAK